MKENEIADTIAGWTQAEAAKGKMLPKKGEEIKSELAEGRGTILFDGDGQPVAYCRYLVWKPDLIEVGGTVVDPDPAADKRRKGVGTKVNLETITKAHRDFPKAIIIGLTENGDSQAMVIKMGGRMKTKTEVDPVLWELCAKPGQECFHLQSFPDCPCTPFDLTHLARKEEIR